MQTQLRQLAVAARTLAHYPAVILSVLGLLVLLAVASLFKQDSSSVAQPDPSAVHRQLEGEYAAIDILPGSVRTSYN